MVFLSVAVPGALSADFGEEILEAVYSLRTCSTIIIIENRNFKLWQQDISGRFLKRNLES